MTTVASRVLDALVAEGVTRVFGIPGGAIARVYAELGNRGDIEVVNAAHESNAVFLAMGHALATGSPAVACVTAGPGVTNALTGLASAHFDGVPVCVIAGEVPQTSFGRGALQEGSAHGFNAIQMARPITKFAAQIARPHAAAATVRRAFATMQSGRPGAAFLSLPLDVSNAEAAQQVHAGIPELTFRSDRAACERAADLLCQAERPLLLVGAGARGAAARDAVVALARRAAIPVASTPKGKGLFPEDDPLYLGVLGFGGHESVVRYLEAAPDVVLVAGSGLNDMSTNAWTPKLRASRAFIHVDVDACQIGKNYPVELGIVGPLELVARAIAEHVRDVRPRGRHGGVTLQRLAGSSRGMLTTAEVVRAMNELCPHDALFTSDMGEHLSAALHYLRVRESQRFLTALGFGSMGSGVVCAIGHAIGDPSRRAYALCGDGGFLMSGNELQTAVRRRANVTFVVINDSGFNMCRHGIHDIYGARTDCSLAPVDFAIWARAMGAPACVVHTPAELCEALRPREGPMVLDVRVDPDVRLTGSERVAALRQFSEQPHDAVGHLIEQRGVHLDTTTEEL